MLKKERFEAFTDAVIAIILTILVLELKLPGNDHSIHALIKILPKFAAYIMTFIFIATMWVNHHFLFSQAKGITNQIIWTNFVWLFIASLLPATTAWLGSDIFARTSAILYVINVVLFNLATLLLRRQVTSKNNLNNMQNLSRKEHISMAVNLLTLVVTWFFPPFPLCWTHYQHHSLVASSY
ncbi:TMEM175 family protein [Companilactobacillus huachuanensis]|uniref:TMEM175 family protein n=1 Tax=Companilactobacillus huachuanensis TaxID=2559914 RepID=A0ABW1RLR3_9LACO|nr:TMEM175 family protein [Companilactobacillus huachuanensis]